ncbi:MAG: NifU family protein [Candidatus Kapaibacterium sp.]
MSEGMPDTVHVETTIRRLLQEQVMPYVASHGGELVYAGFADGVVSVYLRGACERCSAMDITLRFGIERILRRGCAEVDRVVLASDPDVAC